MTEPRSAADHGVTGRKLDVLVAEKVFGWTWEAWLLNPEQPHLVPPDYDHKHSDVWWWGRMVYELVPEYSTDLGAAWAVVEKLRLAVIPDTSGGWRAANEPYIGPHWYEVNVHDWEWSETAPLAICRAALKAVDDHE